MWSLCQKISGLTSINPYIHALNYGRDMEQHACNAFFEIFNAATKSQGYVVECYFLMVSNHSLVLVLMEL